MPVRRQPPPARQHQIGQAKQGIELLGVFLQPPIARLAVVKHVPDHMEGIRSGADHRLDLLESCHGHAPRGVRQRPAFARPQGDVPALPLVLFALVHAGVTGIAKGVRLLAIEPRVRLGYIVDIGVCADHRVHQPRVGIRQRCAFMPPAGLRPAQDAPPGALPRLDAVARSAQSATGCPSVWCIPGSRSPVRFLVELGAAIRVASTIAPWRISAPARQGAR